VICKSGSRTCPIVFRDYEQAGVDASTPIGCATSGCSTTRCAIGTRKVCSFRTDEVKSANQLIYNTLHTRLLVEALADAAGARLVTAPMRIPAIRRIRGL